MAREWWHGHSGDHEWQVRAYTGKGVLPGHDATEGHPSERLIRGGNVHWLLIQTNPAGDPEKQRHFWVWNPLAPGSLSAWFRAIQIAAARYGVQLEYEDFDNPEGDE